MKEQIIKAITDSLGMPEDTEGHGYKLYIYKGEWWISHNVVGSGEPVRQWIEREIDKVEVAEIKGTPMPSGWICPRCQKVHSWMVQSCDCYPSVITASTTEPIPENYLNDCIEKATPNLSKIKDVDKELAEIREEDKTCRNCRNKVLSPISKPCSYCLGFDEWEPIK